MKKLKKEVKGVTMVALVVTIIVLLILSAVAINLSTGNNGLFTRGKQATDEHIKQEAKEEMNMKISGIQIEGYGETQKLPTLQYLADKLCEDEEMEYVLLESKKEASLEKIDTGKANSIFTKIKKYPYEFEIDSELKLASIDGIKLATNNETITITRAELNDLIKQEVEMQLNNHSHQMQYYEKYYTDVKVEKNTETYLTEMTLPAGKYVVCAYGFYKGSMLRYYIFISGADVSSSAYDKDGYVGMSISNIVNLKEETTLKLGFYADKDVTVSGDLRAIKIE